MEPMRYELDWRPLEEVLSETECGDFMYMAHVGTIVLYKNWANRRYLNIDSETGKFYQYTNDGYREISREDALNWVRCI